MSNLKSEGECLYCKQKFSKTTINRHLQKHLNEKIKDAKPGKSFLLKVEVNPKRGKWPYFLSIWADGETDLGDIDDFLRQIWLECCGHMSAFTDPRKKPDRRNTFNFFEAVEMLSGDSIEKYENLMEESIGEIPKDRELKHVLSGDTTLIYEYDFGSTTSLQLSVVSMYPIQADEDIVLLSRNDPPEMFCGICGKEPATKLCGVCLGYKEGVFCKKCAKQHAKLCDEYRDYASLPVVNSPRMGVCGYDGGRIDKKRDGFFSAKSNK